MKVSTFLVSLYMHFWRLHHVAWGLTILDNQSNLLKKKNQSNHATTKSKNKFHIHFILILFSSGTAGQWPYLFLSHWPLPDDRVGHWNSSCIVLACYFPLLLFDLTRPVWPVHCLPLPTFVHVHLLSICHWTKLYCWPLLYVVSTLTRPMVMQELCKPARSC
jgi:hypothetical protein